MGDPTTTLNSPTHTICFIPLLMYPPNCITTEELEEPSNSDTEFEGFWKKIMLKKATSSS